MSFSRTSYGLANVRRFLGVDWIVYTEGGSGHYTASDIEAGHGEEATLDAKFWSSIVRNIVGPELRFAVKSVGSKTNLESILVKLAGANHSGVLVAMDSDYDELLGKEPIDDALVVRTFGYSWETDIWFDTKVLVDVVRHIGTLSEDELKEVERLADERAAHLRHSVRWAIVGDALLVSRGSSAIQRDRVMRYIDVSRRTVSVRRDQLRETLRLGRQSASTEAATITLANFEPLRYLIGRFCSKFWLSFTCVVLRNANCDLPREGTFNAVGIACFARHLKSPSRDHYMSEFRRVGLIQ